MNFILKAKVLLQLH